MQTLADYQALPYTRMVEGFHDEDGSFYWLAWIEEMPDCEAEGDTVAAAQINLNGIFDDYIEAMLEFESDIPLPGRFKDKSAEEAAIEDAVVPEPTGKLVPEPPQTASWAGILNGKVRTSPKAKRVYLEEEEDLTRTLSPDPKKTFDNPPVPV